MIKWTMRNEVGEYHVTATLRSFLETVKIKALQPLETSVTIQEMTQCNIPGEFNLQPQCCENLKSRLTSVQLSSHRDANPERK
jgi:hypothetical protein